MPPTRRRFIHLSTGIGAALFPNFIPVLSSAEESPADGVTFYKPRTDGYEAGRTIFNSRISKRPALVAACTTEAGVQSAVLQAREKGLPIAIKSGGHSFEGFSINDGGMVIDLSGLNGLKYEPEHDIFTVGPGAKLRDVSTYLLPKRRLLPAGSCGGVGIGGLALGGGYGLFSREFGLTCDHLVGARIIDGNGELHDTIGLDDHGLLAALRGGGNGNFGVVTELRFHTRPAPENLHAIRYRYRELDAETAVTHLRNWFAASAQLADDTFSAFVLNGTTLTLLLTTTDPAGSDKAEAILNKNSLPRPDNKNRYASTAALSTALRRYEGRPGPLPFKNASAGFYRNFAEIADAAPAVVDLVAKNPGIVFQINTLGGKIKERPHPSLYPHREFGYLGEIQAYWETPDRQDPLTEAVANVQTALRTAGISAHYRNYPDAEFVNPLPAYYGEEGLKFLMEIKRRFDPNNAIHHPQSVPPPKRI